MRITAEELFELLIDLNLFTEQELQLVTCINGFSMETLSDCLFCRYGYDAEQFLEEMQEEEGEEEEEEAE